jgi:hypothetical protein
MRVVCRGLNNVSGNPMDANAKQFGSCDSAKLSNSPARARLEYGHSIEFPKWGVHGAVARLQRMPQSRRWGGYEQARIAVQIAV